MQTLSSLPISKSSSPGLACLVCLVCLACGFAGCSSGSESSLTTFPTAPFQTLPSDSGSLTIELRLAPDQPPPRGQSSAELTVRDATSGALQNDLQIAVVPWMPAMGHGASVVPTVTPKGNGQYLITNLYLFMPGTWQLRTTLVGEGTDSVTPEFSVK
jgi:hypothetical protein